jgi:hypothetical protein
MRLKNGYYFSLSCPANSFHFSITIMVYSSIPFDLQNIVAKVNSEESQASRSELTPWGEGRFVLAVPAIVQVAVPSQLIVYVPVWTHNPSMI